MGRDSADKRKDAIVPNVVGLIFSRDDGRPITKDMIHAQVEIAIRTTKVKKSVFHNYRNTALTEWGARCIGTPAFQCTSDTLTCNGKTSRVPLSFWGRKLLQELLQEKRKGGG